MIKRTIAVLVPGGLTSRVAARVVRHAQDYVCKIECERENGRTSMKSLMAVLSLGLGHGEQLTIITDGEDEGVAMDKLEALLSGEE